MADPVDSGQAGDDVLVAYLDGELGDDERADARGAPCRRRGAEGAARCARRRRPALRRGVRDAAGGGAAGATGCRARRRGRPTPDAVHRARGDGWRWRRPAVAIFAVGAVGGYVGPRLLPAPPQQQAAAQPNWREAVAGYQAFLTAESMSVIAEDPASVGQELAAVGAKLVARPVAGEAGAAARLSEARPALRLPREAARPARLPVVRGRSDLVLHHRQRPARRSRRSSRSATASTSCSGRRAGAATC